MIEVNSNNNLEVATFGAGCFWGIEAKFRKLDGVSDVVVGYAGGNTKEPTYEQVCDGSTGHAECVQITYNIDKISYAQLLDAFWSMHDPTTPDRQGVDIGSQYRSVIFYHSPEQQKIAVMSKDKLSTEKKYNNPIVTEIKPFSMFYKAEEYHQRYLDKNGRNVC